jgi:hypothetical protein
MAVLILTPIGIFLTYQAANDSGLFDMSTWKKQVAWVTKWLPKKSGT